MITETKTYTELMQDWYKLMEPKFEEFTADRLDRAISFARVGNDGVFIAVGKANVDNLLALENFTPATSGELLGSYHDIAVVHHKNHPKNAVIVVAFVNEATGIRTTGRAMTFYTPV